MSVHSNLLVQLFHTAQPVRVVETGLSIQKFPLLIEIRRIDKDQFIARIPIPDGYSSALTKQLKEDFGLNEFGVIHLSSSLDEEFKYNECFLSVKTSPPWPQDEPPYLTVIHSFYMFHRMVNTHNGEELKLLKLLGVKMAAHVLKEVQGKSRRRAHWVFAEASGGNDIVPKQECKQAMVIDEGTVLLEIYQKHPTLLLDIADQALYEVSTQNLREPFQDLLAQTEQNAKLVQYYQKRWGLRSPIVKGCHTTVPMYGLFDDVLRVLSHQ